ncbi:MAG: aldehyde dehydrogenase family protein, partial [Candidatus Thermoplasmatota archaeon]|nr:aldehyde dehydrogenase family protein [Candidatus Thermoplasmatota archaeon]
DGIYDTFMDKFMDAVRKMKVGDIRKKENFMGPVVNKSAFDKYKRISELLPKEGKILTGGKTIPGDGFFVEPTVIEDLKENSFVLKDELFLPILAAVRVKTLKEAIDRINANRSSGGSSGAMVGSQAFVGWKMSGSTGKGTGSFYYLTQFLREQSQTIVH